MSTAQKIVKYIEEHTTATGSELANEFSYITSRAIRKQLKNLYDKKILKKIGTPPKVYYLIQEEEKYSQSLEIDSKTLAIINKQYLYISPTGESFEGWEGFQRWCQKTEQDTFITAKEYVQTVEKYASFKKYGLIDGLMKLQSTFVNVYVDALFYIEFYSIERFGKTKLGQMLLYAKQSQNKLLIHKLIQQIKPNIERLIIRYKIDGIIFIPPSVKREIQFMKELEKKLQLTLKTLTITKVRTQIIVPQKTLSKLEDRIENAKKTIIVADKSKYNNVLIIDDAIGSGATINETAKHLREKNIVNGKIIGLAITGSFKGFDVISEV